MPKALPAIDDPAVAKELAAIAKLVGHDQDSKVSLSEAVKAALTAAHEKAVDKAVETVRSFPLSADTMTRCEKYAKSWHHAVASVCQVELPRELRKIKP